MSARDLTAALVAFLLGSGACAYCQVRQTQGLNDGWQYLEEDIADIASLGRATKHWQHVRLPHTWNVWDALDNEPGYRRGVGWYKRELALPPTRKDARFILLFEGVNMRSDVYVNGRRVGGHIGGYIGFEIDITPYVKRDRRNILAVKVNNSPDPDVIPSQKSDFFLYGGITRNVWLRVVPSRYIEYVRIHTPVVGEQSAETTVDVGLENTSTALARVDLKAVVTDPGGRVVTRESTQVAFPPGKSSRRIPLPVVSNPSLWSPAHPTLYTATVDLKISGTVIDRSTDRFGYRWFEFKEHGPFLLNGKRLLLRGTHRHEEWSGYGNALPDSLQRKEMKMIKEMGANFVRLAHYPQAPEVYRACDELGLLVWDELPWCRGGMGGDRWKSNTKRLLNEMIEQNFNHPSIIVWCLGNELDWLPDFPGGDNHDSLCSMLGELNSIAHRLDSGRVTATRRFDEAADKVDLHSSSIWMGWYSSSFGYRNYERAITEARRKFKRFFHAEYGGDSHRGRHSENPVDGEGNRVSTKGNESMLPVASFGDWSENYIVDLLDWHLHVAELSDSLSGNAQWIFRDFGTPLRPENPIPYVNEKGLCDFAGEPKDAYYVYKSYWTAEPKFCYIESHTWKERSGPKDVEREVEVYSNTPEVELMINGVSQGRVRRDVNKFPACGLVWRVGFAEGKNILVAIGFDGRAEVARDTMVMNYTYRQAGSAQNLELSSVTLPDGNMLVTALAVDRAGQRSLDYNKRIYFSSMGGGRLRSGFGTSTRSNPIEMANGKAQIEFVLEPSEKGIIEARTQDFRGTYLVIPGQYRK